MTQVSLSQIGGGEFPMKTPCRFLNHTFFSLSCQLALCIFEIQPELDSDFKIFYLIHIQLYSTKIFKIEGMVRNDTFIETASNDQNITKGFW